MYTYEELKQFVEHCSRCPLSQTRIKAVMGKGNLKSPVLFVAEAPGRNENRDGVPFTGKSGVLFDRLLSEINLSREEVYITNVVKCNPPGNRDPHYKITREHGTFLFRKNTWLTAFYHPSAVLRDEGKLGEMQADFQKLKEKLGEINA